MSKPVIAVAVCTLLALVAACVWVPVDWYAGHYPEWLGSANAEWYDEQDRKRNQPLVDERRQLEFDDPDSPRIAEINALIVKPLPEFVPPPAPRTNRERELSRVSYTWVWRAHWKPADTGIRAVVRGQVLAGTQALILLFGGALLTVVVRRERRRKAAA